MQKTASSETSQLFARIIERFSSLPSVSSTKEGGFFFHPSEQKSLVGDPGQEKATQRQWFPSTATEEPL
jgi:hypothetical protein